MRRNFSVLGVLLALIIGARGVFGAGPAQDVPPQPYFEDFFSGVVTLEDRAAPVGLALLACIDACQTGFQGQPVQVEDGGLYHLLEVFPPREKRLMGHTITFYLVNDFGRIRAAETAIFESAPNRHTLNLTFRDPLPVPPTPLPPPSLPAVGDATLARLPGWIVGIGAVALFAGAGLLLLARMRTA